MPVTNISEAMAKREGWIGMEGPAVPIPCESVFELTIDAATEKLIDPQSINSVEFAARRPRPTLVVERSGGSPATRDVSFAGDQFSSQFVAPVDGIGQRDL